MPVAPDSPPALRMEGVSKQFGPVQALSGVTFTARPGTVHAICGENGAGKSTLMKILAGVHHPDTGYLFLKGEEHRFATPADAITAGVAMIYQELDLAPDLTVTENLFLGRELSGRLPFALNHAAMLSATRALIAEHGFTLDATTPVQDLSAGGCQVVEILKALHRDASVLVMDEPTSSLSEAEADVLFQIVRQLRERGLTVLYISHRMEEIMDLADEITVLRDGQVTFTGPVDSTDIATVIQHMVGREITDFFPARDAIVSGEIALETRGITSDEGIRDISFSIRRGEVVGLAGLVGSGRTEVARALFGVTRPSAGQIYLDGEPVTIGGPDVAVRLGIGYLTEDRKRTGLCPGLPCSWNITLPNYRHLGMGWRIPAAQEETLAHAAGQDVSVRWASPSAPANTLSGGNQQKLLVARWLQADARLLIFDEPTRGVDVGAKREIYLLINRLATEGKAVLVISSEFGELFGICDRLLVMRRGQLAANLKTTATTPDEVLHLAAVGEK